MINVLLLIVFQISPLPFPDRMGLSLQVFIEVFPQDLQLLAGSEAPQILVECVRRDAATEDLLQPGINLYFLDHQVFSASLGQHRMQNSRELDLFVDAGQVSMDFESLASEGKSGRKKTQ